MDFQLTDDQHLLADSADRFGRATGGLDGLHRTTTDRTDAWRAQWSAYAEQGWLALPFAEEAGGLGGTTADVCVLLEAFGRWMLPGPYVDVTLVGAGLLALGRNPAVLQSVLDGEATPLLAHLEPGLDCEYERTIRTNARRSSGGWIIDGVKSPIVHGDDASAWLVTAVREGTGTLGIFKIERDAAGVSCRRYPLIDGSHAIDLHLDGVQVDDDALVTEIAPSSPEFDAILDRAVVASMAVALGAMDAVLEQTAEYLKTRTQFGGPIARFQALQHRMAEMLIETEQARSVLLRALATIDGPDPVARGRDASALKAFVSGAGAWVIEQGIQLHGGVGVTDELAIGHHYKSMLALSRRFGDRAFHLRRAARLRESAQESVT